MSGEKAKRLTESLGQRDSDLFQQLGVSTEWKKKEKLEERKKKTSDDSVNIQEKPRKINKSSTLCCQKQSEKQTLSKQLAVMCKLQSSLVLQNIFWSPL